MKINIRNAVQEDCARIGPLQKEIADLHHEGRPDLFNTEAIAFYKSCGMTDRIRRMEYRLED